MYPYPLSQPDGIDAVLCEAILPVREVNPTTIFGNQCNDLLVRRLAEVCTESIMIVRLPEE